MKPKSPFSFLQEGGEMGALTREFDWSKTTIGTPDQWPQSLRTTVGIVLNSKFPMFLFWGPELVCFYNDAFRPSLGSNGKHPTALGEKGAKVWPEIWAEIKPLIDQVLTGEATWSEDQLLPIFRNNKLEDAYWTYSYSPVFDESGVPAGVFVTCMETTAQKKAEGEKQKLVAIIEASHEFIGLAAMDLSVQYANPAALKMLGWDGIEGKSILDCIYTEDHALAKETLFQLLQNGHSSQEIRFVNAATGQPFWLQWNNITIEHPKTGEIIGLATVSVDITERKKAEQALKESEQNFRNLVMQAPVGICIVKGDSSVVEVANDTYLELAGKERQNFEGRPIWEALPEAESDFAPILANVIKTAVAYVGRESEVHLIRNGKKETVFVNFVYEPIKERDGSVEKVMILAIDVTDLVMARKKIESSEARFRLMADAMPQFVWTADAEGNLNYYNQAVFNYTGLSFEQIQRDGWLQIVHPDDRAENTRLWLQAVTSGKDFAFHHRFKNKDGEYRWQLSRAVPQKDASGTIQLWIGTSTDIHDQKLFEEELNKQVKERTADLESKNKELERSNQNLEEFAHAASHDLKEPIRKIHFFTDRLKNMLSDRLKEEETLTFMRIDNASQRMGSLIDDLLLYSHVSQHPHQKQDVDLNKKVSKVLEDLELDMQQKSAVITVDPLPTVKGYSRQLQQLFQNLIGNALKYSKQDVLPRITITSSEVTGAQSGVSMSEEDKSRNYHLIEVKDNGIGFEQKESERIFQMFQRLHGNAEYRGTGVGLSIARKVVENHEGFIYARSEPGKGATFYIGLPIA